MRAIRALASSRPFRGAIPNVARTMLFLGLALSLGNAVSAKGPERGKDRVLVPASIASSRRRADDRTWKMLNS
jgi:hypothetical protein